MSQMSSSLLSLRPNGDSEQEAPLYVVSCLHGVVVCRKDRPDEEPEPRGGKQWVAASSHYDRGRKYAHKPPEN